MTEEFKLRKKILEQRPPPRPDPRPLGNACSCGKPTRFQHAKMVYSDGGRYIEADIDKKHMRDVSPNCPPSHRAWHCDNCDIDYEVDKLPSDIRHNIHKSFLKKLLYGIFGCEN